MLCDFRFLFLGSSWIASMFLVVNAALGAGLLNFPAAYDKSGGIVAAISIQAVRFSVRFCLNYYMAVVKYIWTSKYNYCLLFFFDFILWCETWISFMSMEIHGFLLSLQVMLTFIMGAFFILAYCSDLQQTATYQVGKILKCNYNELIECLLGVV